VLHVVRAGSTPLMPIACAVFFLVLTLGLGGIGVCVELQRSGDSMDPHTMRRCAYHAHAGRRDALRLIDILCERTSNLEGESGEFGALA
jgi:hypothetical protein